jgi:hypothetical protein
MERQKPDTTSNEIDLYIRTYYSLLRSSGEVRVRAFEEAHAFSNASLHAGAREPAPDVAAFGYAAARLPDCMPAVRRVVLGQSDSTFARFGYPVGGWCELGTLGRRRRIRWDGERTLAAYIASSSDIDDLVPIITAYQIEWNKMHRLLRESPLAERLVRGGAADEAELAEALGVGKAEAARLREALGSGDDALRALAEHPMDLAVRLLAGAFSEYQRAAQLWWEGVERTLPRENGRRVPIYFVSSNTHALPNLLGGFAHAHRDALLEGLREDESLRSEIELAIGEGGASLASLLYFALRAHRRRAPGAREAVRAWDFAVGIRPIENRAHVDVDGQVIEIARLDPRRFDARLAMPGLERLRRSDALILNIDYPLGMAAYHLLSRVSYGVGRLLGAYVMGKAATLNGQVGDVMISRVVHDEHSDNTYLFRNAFGAEDVAPYLRHGTVLDNQKAVTVRGAFLQNPNYLGVFYREGYTVLEMESGPYLSALYEAVDPRRHPDDEIVSLTERTDLDLGLLHYASDTPYSRRQWLLSKSLGLPGVDSTYACAIAITRRILHRELDRVAAAHPQDR